jgi:acyl-CoA reductase-like NAD-dependent aldehyde dehydrogenase
VDAAQSSFSTWKRTAPKARARILHDIADLMAADADALSTLVTLEVGKPLEEARVRSSTRQSSHAGTRKRRAAFTAGPRPAARWTRGGISSVSRSAW